MKVEHATDEEPLRRLREYAAKTGTTVAVDRVNGHWRPGFIANDKLGEVAFALHTVGPDETTAIRKLADLVAGGRLEKPAAQPGEQ